jgi:hypothetical protein
LSPPVLLFSCLILFSHSFWYGSWAVPLNW